MGSPRHWTPAARPSNRPPIQPHKILTGGNLCESKLTFHATVCVSYPCPWIRQTSRDVPADAALLIDHPFVRAKPIAGMWDVGLVNFDWECLCQMVWRFGEDPDDLCWRLLLLVAEAHLAACALGGRPCLYIWGLEPREPVMELVDG